MPKISFLGIIVSRKSRNGLKNQISAIHSERNKGIKINIGKQIIKFEEQKAFFNFKVIDDIVNRPEGKNDIRSLRPQ